MCVLKIKVIALDSLGGVSRRCGLSWAHAT